MTIHIIYLVIGILAGIVAQGILSERVIRNLKRRHRYDVKRHRVYEPIKGAK